MSAILIRTDNKNGKILKALAKRLGASVVDVKMEEFEDFSLGLLMKKVKTGEKVHREIVMKELERK